MKLNASDFGRKCQFPLLLALGALPAALLIALRCAPQTVSLVWAFPAVYVLLAWLCLILPGRVRLPAGLLGAASLMLLGFRLLPIQGGANAVNSYTVALNSNLALLLIPLLFGVLLLCGLRFAALPRDQEIAFNWFAAGMIVHLLVQLVAYVERRSGSQAWIQVTQPLLLAFIGFLALAMLSLTRSAMYSAAQGRQRVPEIMRRRNTAVTLILLAAALLIAAIPAIGRGLRALWRFALRIVAAVLSFLAGLLGSESAPSSASGGMEQDMLTGLESSEPSLLAVVLERVAIVLALIAAAFALFWALRIIVKKLRVLLRALLDRLGLFAASASQDYVDEVTDTRDDGGERENTLLSRIRSRLAFVRERSLSPAERIRYRYRLLMKRHPDWHRSRTARENLPPQAAALYEQARYSGREVTAQEAEAFVSGTKDA